MITFSNILHPPRRGARLLVKPSISTQVEARESSAEAGLASKNLYKIDKDADYALGLEIEKKEELLKPFANTRKPVRNLRLYKADVFFL